MLRRHEFRNSPPLTQKALHGLQPRNLDLSHSTEFREVRIGLFNSEADFLENPKTKNPWDIIPIFQGGIYKTGIGCIDKLSIQIYVFNRIINGYELLVVLIYLFYPTGDIFRLR